MKNFARHKHKQNQKKIFKTFSYCQCELQTKNTNQKFYCAKNKNYKITIKKNIKHCRQFVSFFQRYLPPLTTEAKRALFKSLATSEQY